MGDAATGEPFTVRHQELGTMLLNELQQQDRQLEAQTQDAGAGAGRANRRPAGAARGHREPPPTLIQGVWGRGTVILTLADRTKVRRSANVHAAHDPPGATRARTGFFFTIVDTEPP